MNQDQFSNPILKRNSKDTLIKSSAFHLKDSLVNEQDTSFHEPILTTVEKDDSVSIPISSEESNYQVSPWFIGVLLAILILISKIKLTFPRLTPIVFNSIYRSSEAMKLQNSRNTRNKVCYSLMNTLSLLVFSVFTFELSVYYKIISKIDFSSFVYIIIFIFSFCLFKIIMVRILGFIFKASREASEYSFNLLLVCKTVGMILIPFILVLPFINYSVVGYINIIGMFIVGFAYVLIIFRGLRIIFLKHISVLYMILYLCALEIMPFLIISKLILSK